MGPPRLPGPLRCTPASVFGPAARSIDLAHDHDQLGIRNLRRCCVYDALASIDSNKFRCLKSTLRKQSMNGTRSYNVLQPLPNLCEADEKLGCGRKHGT